MARKGAHFEEYRAMRNKGKFITIVAIFPISLVMLVLKMVQVDKNSGFFYLLFFLSAILLLIIYNALRHIFSKKPALVVSEDGLIDNISQAKAGLIPWTNIHKTEIKKYMKRDHLLIYLIEPKSVLHGNKRLAEIMLEEIGTPIAVSLELLKDDPTQLKKAIDRGIKAKGNPSTHP